jgi:hypothetical protein
MRIKRFQGLEVPVASGSSLTKFFFSDQPQLRNAHIQAIQVYNINATPFSILSGLPGVTDADLSKSYLTLYQGDLQLIYQLPLVAISNIVKGSGAYVFELPEMNDQDISWTKSYISLPTALATTGVAYSFGVYYYM